jgi:hypothetical protein
MFRARLRIRIHVFLKVIAFGHVKIKREKQAAFRENHGFFLFVVIYGFRRVR